MSGIRVSLFNALRCLLISSLLIAPAWAESEAASSEDVRGTTVYFYAWGGSGQVNQYLRWADRQLRQDYGIKLQHVKVSDIAEAVNRLQNDQKAGRDNGGEIDLLWINGENFHTLKRNDLILPELLGKISNRDQLLIDELPLMSDFGVPVEGYEVPWGVGQFNVIGCAGCIEEKTVTPASLLAFAQNNPGRLTYPKPPDFVGTTWLKSLLQALSDDDERLYEDAHSESINALLPQLWDYLDKLHPLLWQKGESFPESAAQQLQYFADGKLAIALSFNPNEVQALVRSGQLPAGVKQHYFSQGAITNSHYLAVPRNASHPEAAVVVIDFLLSQQAQERKADPEVWGDPPVVSLDGESRSSLLPSAQELHASWQDILEAHWLDRYQ